MKYLIGFLICLYCIFCAGLYFVQEKVIFRPEKISESYNYGLGKEVEIKLNDQISMNALIVQDNPSKKSNNAILYLHGNRGSIRFGAYQIRQMKGNGYDILIPDYRGYGKTEGQPIDDQQLLEDAAKAYKYLSQSYHEENILVIGYSLGSGMASYIAEQFNPKHLLLIAPFTSLNSIKNQFLWFAPDFLLKYQLNNLKHLEKVKCPTTILHGTEDHVVSYDHALELVKKFSDKLKLITAEGIGHRRIIFDQRIREIINGI